MSVIIQIERDRAIIVDAQWRSRNRELATLLNRFLQTDFPGPEHGDPELYAAERAIDFFGGEIIKHSPLKQNLPRDAVL